MPLEYAYGTARVLAVWFISALGSAFFSAAFENSCTLVHCCSPPACLPLTYPSLPWLGRPHMVALTSFAPVSAFLFHLICPCLLAGMHLPVSSGRASLTVTPFLLLLFPV